MPNNWKTYKLEELSERICVGFVGTCHKYYTDSGIGVPMIRTTNLTEKGLDLNEVQYISKEFHLKQKKSQLKKGDILIARHGTNGQACLYDLDEDANCLNVVIVKPNHSLVDYRWLLYSINSPSFRNQVDAHSTGSVQKVVNTTTLAQFKLNVPKLKEQKAIANILSAIDDKIENNLAINKTLEDMAMALYKHWFVDFGPFQDGEFIDSELGLIPKGWEVKRLGDMLEIKYGKDHKKLNDGKIPVYGSGGIMRYVDEFLYDKDSILIPRKGTLSNLFYVKEPFWSVDTIFYTKFKEPAQGKYLFHCLKSMDLASMDVGSAVPSLTTNLLKRLEIILPEIGDIQKFENQINRFFNQIELNKKENQSLTQLRDTLLPKLISGEVRLKEFKEQVEQII